MSNNQQVRHVFDNNSQDLIQPKEQRIDRETPHLITVAEKVDNILQLPTKMLEKIFAYVPKQLPVGQTCKKFYEVSCNVKFFDLQIHTNRNGYKYNGKRLFLNNHKMFDSIMTSGRRFKSLRFILFPESNYPNNVDRFKFVIQRFKKCIERIGKDVKELKVTSRIRHLPENIIELLNLMPNLEKVSMSLVWRFVPVEGKLNLPKLKSLKIVSCSELVLDIFRQLPPDVLEEIEVRSINGPTLDVIEAFPNQCKVKKILADRHFTRRFKWQQTKLKSLKIEGAGNLEHILKGQDEMVSFTYHSGNNRTDLEVICEELKSLVELDIESCRFAEYENPELSKLRNLKSLKLHGLFRENNGDILSFLNMLKSDSLEKLSIDCCRFRVTKLKINQLAFNFPALTELELSLSAPLYIIETIFQRFPNLKALKFNSCLFVGYYVFQEGLSHKKLKSLEIYNPNFCVQEDLPKLIGCCEKLEDLKLTSVINEKILAEILILKPNLKSLTLQNNYQKITKNFVAVLKEHGKKLESFNCSFHGYENGTSAETLQQEFKDIFESVTVSCKARYFITSPEIKWEMKKV